MAFTQSSLDSLYAIWEDESKADTIRLQAFNSYIGKGFIFSNPDTARILIEEQYSFAEDHQESYWMAVAQNSIGICHALRSEMDSAIFCYKKAVDLYVIARDSRGVAQTFNNIALTYQYRGDYDNAIFYHSNVYKVGQFIADTALMSASKVNLAGIYRDLGDNEQAMSEYQSAYDMSMNCYGTVDGEIISAIGTSYFIEKDYDNSLLYYQDALNENRKRGNKAAESGTLTGIGAVYTALGELEKGMGYFQEGLAIQEELNLQNRLGATNISIGANFIQQKNWTEALKYTQRGLDIAIQNELTKDIMEGAQNMYKIQSELGNKAEALKMLEFSISARDSLESETNQHALIAQSLRHEFDKEEALAAVEYEMQLAHQKEVLEQGKTQRNIVIYAVSIGLVLVLIFCIFLINRFRITRSQKEVIELQKLTVETKNKEIVDSINYAQRIQSAILPPGQKIENLLPESFVLYLPKDIVAGDFYWVEQIENQTIFAVADCTGHGVPGAMVSVVCHNALNRTIREFMLKEPGTILDKTNELVEEAFEASEGAVKDGMDIALCSIDKDKQKLYYAGANNPLWIIRNKELIEVKADKQPIGSYNERRPFVTHQLPIQKDDVIYLFSDGIADQFGGVEGKKFKYRRLKELLLELHQKPMKEQASLIEETHLNWRGELDQLDDVCLMGLRV